PLPLIGLAATTAQDRNMPGGTASLNPLHKIRPRVLPCWALLPMKALSATAGGQVLRQDQQLYAKHWAVQQYTMSLRFSMPAPSPPKKPTWREPSRSFLRE